MCQVKRRSFLGLSATILRGGLIAGKTGYGLVNGSKDAPGSAHHHVHTVSLMTETANRSLAALSSKQRAKATFQFSDDEHMNWQFIPKERKGLALGELSQTRYIKAVTIMSLERPSLTRPRQNTLVTSIVTSAKQALRSCHLRSIYSAWLSLQHNCPVRYVINLARYQSKSFRAAA